MKVEIAYDKKNNCFVAYNIEIDIVATGVCVNSAIENFESKRLERIAEFEEERLIK